MDTSISYSASVFIYSSIRIYTKVDISADDLVLVDKIYFKIVYRNIGMKRLTSHVNLLVDKMECCDQ